LVPDGGYSRNDSLVPDGGSRNAPGTLN
jgi:hypothetical protein